MAEIEQKFKVGDIVVLKSGSPKMTISELDMSRRRRGATTGKFDVFTGSVNCQWFLNNELQTATFNQDSLELFTE
ncbi:DUF2158 domain-containing protein [Flavobacterium columnare]|uniref:YodC family protein n=1 Tax=Flavobacterium columnare TaxID=996 RepID=UPI001785FC75|nr:DUF2158 domain-containing protein [Flavobacterium columnare]QOG88767.1 DUF2158 domain-containing protein [Flavobacterium columnare]QOG91426.1 DUF2158 domain-containing protein [Flavobacterium columnare]QOG94089.1 DUF2158 domain-containing protein [Flavobacterium columnare]QOG96748.1 DUF2158 domain-containing protein [Flavobacterium columnare]QOG99406.1 DUF2158 domain-containing protein [Flavobacterium columnare]